MKFVRYQASGAVQWGVKRDDRIYSLAGLYDDIEWPRFTNPSFRNAVKRKLEHKQVETVGLDEVIIRPPVEQPGKIVSVGLNYPSHAAEQDAELPEKPLLFSKSPSSTVGHGDDIVLPESVDQVDYEGELAVVIGREARNVSAVDAYDYVAGYTVFNDVSARSAQYEDGQFFRGKSYQTFAPMGPVLVSGDFDPDDADLSLQVNGERRQRANTSELNFNVAELIEFISGVMMLEPGDVISTGTPAGVGIFHDPPVLLNPGDTVEITISGIGTLRNPVVEE